MRADRGDWVVMETLHQGQPRRYGQIVEVLGPGGDTPPYRVRWMDGGGPDLLFPGPQVRVLHPEEAVGPEG